MNLAMALLLVLATPDAPRPVHLIDLVCTDIDGKVVRLGGDTLRPIALVFLDTGCPIGRAYSPRLNELAADAARRGVEFYGVLSDPALSWVDARKYRDEYQLSFPVLMDSSGELASRLKPAVVPEAFVISRADRITYRGRIDDRYAAPGKPRKRVSSHDLRDAIAAVAEPTAPKPRRTQAVGCDFEAWAAPTPRKVTWARHVAPILNAHCVECHRPGAIGPFDLEGYDNARRRSRMIARVTESGLMPPWHAKEGHGSFRDSRVLGEREKAILRAWVEQGAPKGDEREAPAPPAAPESGWPLGEPDLEVTLPEPFQVPAQGEDIYRYFVIPMELVEDEAVVAFDFQPGDPAVVHHCIAYVDHSGWARKMDAKDPKPGFSVFGNTEGLLKGVGQANIGGIGGWAPGARPYELPPDHGMYLKAGGDLVLEIHYHLTGKATTDQSRCAFWFAKKEPKRWVEGLVIGTQEIDIRPGDSDHWRHFWMKLPSTVDLIDIGPHMHFLGKDVHVLATLPDGTKKPLLRLDWDFRWQSVYVYRAPVHLPKGTRIDAWYRFDNSKENPANPHSPPAPIKWGWGTGEEMAELYLTVVPENASEFPRLERASMMSWFRGSEAKSRPPWIR